MYTHGARRGQQEGEAHKLIGLLGFCFKECLHIKQCMYPGFAAQLFPKLTVVLR